MQSRIYTWEHNGADRVQVRLLFKPYAKLDVAVWWNNQCAQPSLLLWVVLGASLVRFGDLTGNQYGTPLHHIGLGTFAVNCAIQVLHAAYRPDTQVSGFLSNPNDNYLSSELQEQLAKNRRAFWRQFGLGISPGCYERLSGTVGGLTPVIVGSVAGQFPRYLPLKEFTYMDSFGNQEN